MSDGGKRRRRPLPPKARAQAEAEVLEKGRWSQLHEQAELQARNHSEQENCVARRRCREFLEGGWGSVDWIELYGQK